MVWQLCDGTRTAGELVQMLVDAFPGNSIAIARDVQSILRYFSAKGCIDIELNREPPASGKPLQGKRKRPKATSLVVSEPEIRKQRVRYSALLNGVELWFEMAAKHNDRDSATADPFLLVSMMHAMRARKPLKVEGAPVTSGLLENLEEFQRAWARWRTELEPVVVDASVASVEHWRRNPAIATFSGGVDSSYTVYRHLVNPDRKWLPDLKAVMMLQGFDSNLEDDEKFKHSFNNGCDMLRALPLELISVQTNIKHHLGNWLDCHGLLLGAALSLFRDRFGTGIIANTSPYEMLLPLGSNPLTDALMGSDGFRILHHGGEVSRFEKILAMADWPPLQDHLRVCWQPDTQGTLNCGKCLSCLLAALTFRCLGKSPACLPVPDDPSEVAQTLANQNYGRLDWYDMKCIAQEAEKRGLDDAEWLLPVKQQLATMQ